MSWNTQRNEALVAKQLDFLRRMRELDLLAEEILGIYWQGAGGADNLTEVRGVPVADQVSAAVLATDYRAFWNNGAITQGDRRGAAYVIMGGVV